VDQHKHAVVLLDEIEKAHADIYNILLQVMDHGSLTDALGKKVDFRNVVLIMTTNAGASDAQRNSIGFGRGSARARTRRPSSACSRRSSATAWTRGAFSPLTRRSSARWCTSSSCS
jgi:ATP-dependent Clp protease ATP-binding subunit ClpA